MQTEKSFKHVTNRQGVRLVDFAQKAGVSREEFSEFLKNEEKKKKFFDELRNGDNDDWFEKLQTEANKIGARVYFLKLKVDYTRSHNESAMAGGSQTGPNDDVLKVAYLYQPSETEVTDEVIILFNWIEGDGNYQKAVDWGLQNGLLKTTPHVPFAIGQQFPKLNYELGLNPMYVVVVETTGCSFTFSGDAFACSVYWRADERRSRLSWQGGFKSDRSWFAFRKKVSPK